MDPPTLTGKPMAFWLDLRNDLQTALYRNKAILYFRAYGSAANVYPGHWPAIKWTLEDFAYFFDCPEMEAALYSYINEYVRNTTAPTRPDWWQVVDTMNTVLANPANVNDYLNIKPLNEINKSKWQHNDYIAAFIFRLLHYRNHLEAGTAATRDEFQTRQANYAASFGQTNPFYGAWTTYDKWACAFLLYTKLAAEREAFFEGNGGPINIQPGPQNTTAPPQQPIQQPVQQPVQQPTQTSYQQLFQTPVQQPVQPPAQQPVQPPAQQPVQPPVQQPVQPPVQQPVQQPIVTPSQQTNDGENLIKPVLRARQTQQQKEQQAQRRVRFDIKNIANLPSDEFDDQRQKMFEEQAKAFQQRQAAEAQQQAQQQAVQQPVQTPVQQPVQQPEWQSFKKPWPLPMRESFLQQSAQQPIQQPVQLPTQQPVQQPVQQQVRQEVMVGPAITW